MYIKSYYGLVCLQIKKSNKSAFKYNDLVSMEVKKMSIRKFVGTEFLMDIPGGAYVMAKPIFKIRREPIVGTFLVRIFFATFKFLFFSKTYTG